jgi:hypothetical protein
MGEKPHDRGPAAYPLELEQMTQVKLLIHRISGDTTEVPLDPLKDLFATADVQLSLEQNLDSLQVDPALHQKSLLHRIFRYKNRALWSRKSLQNEAKKVLLTDGSAC